ncbi:MAG: biotin synthase BioB [Planctomycetia bacterium]|nr:biotin synthase BioB [Planctomycetia bacterium]
MTYVDTMLEKVLRGEAISREEALRLYEEPLEELASAAQELRARVNGNGFDLCSILNGKSGRCSENCKFCAQSSHCHTQIEKYPLVSRDAIIEAALLNARSGALRFSVVTSGKRLSDAEIDVLCEAFVEIRKRSDIALCVSIGLQSQAQFERLRASGVTRSHNNLETSRRFFPSICTSHTYDEKIAALTAARNAGMTLCSGGIFGLGETLEDRVDMALTLRELGIKSIPINIFTSIPGLSEPLVSQARLRSEEVERIVAVYRFILPDASLRLAGGRLLLSDQGRGAFCSGANAAITGHMLTTDGINAPQDLKILKELGFEPKRLND